MKKYLLTSIGRTATLSLATYLDSLDGVQSFHEKEKSDVPILFLSQLSEYSLFVTNYFTQRNASIENKENSVYIEVNPYFRFLSPSLLEPLDWQKIFLIRHPKTYLESVFQRKIYTENDVLLNQIPSNTDPAIKNWPHWTRFQKLCWYYMKVHDHILSSNTKFFKFEEITTDSTSLKQLLQALSIDVTSVTNFTLPKVNKAADNAIKNKLREAVKGNFKSSKKLVWSDLSKEELATYENLCKPIAEKIGYVL